MRRLACLFAFSLFAAASAWAQTRNAPPPVEDVPPPPPMEIIDDSFEPEVTIRKREGDTVEEHRVNGRLYKIVVTPEHGVPYTLIDPKGDGTFVPLDQGAPQLAVPMWVIGTF